VNHNADFGSEQGSAILDFIGFGVLLQIPILMFATLAVQTQQQSFAIEAIARHSLRAHVLFAEPSNTNLVIQGLAEDFGLKPERLEWNLSCKPDPSCRALGSTAEMEVRLGDLVAFASQRF
jgi:hypothetical protein